MSAALAVDVEGRILALQMLSRPNEYMIMHQNRPSFIKRIDRLAKNLSTGARQYDQSRVTIGLRLLSLFWRRGFRPGEALKLGLANPTISQEALRACFTRSGVAGAPEPPEPAER